MVHSVHTKCYASMRSQKHVRGVAVSRSKLKWMIWALITLIAILAIAISPAVVATLRKENAMGPKSTVLIPLYIYPGPGAWTPLENV